MAGLYTIDILKEKSNYHIDHIIELQIINHVLNNMNHKFIDYTLKRIIDHFNSIDNLQVIEKSENIIKNQSVATFLHKRLNKEKINDQEILKYITTIKKKWNKIKEDLICAEIFIKKMDELFDNYQ